MFSDLVATMRRLDAQIINGAGTSGEQPLLNTPGINAVTYTDASPTLLSCGCQSW